jgi:hypothetical protein
MLPWTIHYHRDFRESPVAHKDFGHALVHVFKAAGKLASLVNDAEHGGCSFTAEETDRYIADLVVCALRLANTVPGRTVDLEEAVIDRIITKNGLRIECDHCGERTGQLVLVESQCDACQVGSFRVETDDDRSTKRPTMPDR